MRAPQSARLVVALAALLAGGAAWAETPIPPPPTDWVTDAADFLSPEARSELDTRLGNYATTTGHQVLVYIDHTTGGVPIEDWAVKAFERWKVGRKGIDDGAVLFVFKDDHRLRIEVGYGLEDRVPDLIASRIINDGAVPRIKAGDNDGAIRTAVDQLTQAIGSEGGAVAPHKTSIGGLALIVILALLAGGFIITHPALAAVMLASGGRGGWGGGGGFGGGGFGGGGGFSGGGGGSGGGGASGSW
jgi:uncharacterized protein